MAEELNLRPDNSVDRNQVQDAEQPIVWHKCCEYFPTLRTPTARLASRVSNCLVTVTSSNQPRTVQLRPRSHE